MAIHFYDFYDEASPGRGTRRLRTIIDLAFGVTVAAEIRSRRDLPTSENTVGMHG